ncbi:hypothetical protein JCM8547_003956 [Rhodosporidiobolus lusitaniae]
MPTIAVIGATGTQGSSVVSALFTSTSFSVKALTRDPSSDKAKALGSHDRLELVKADLHDVESVKKALEGVKGVFAMTESGPGEEEQGKNLVDAVKAAGVELLVLSSLPSIARATNGKYTGVFSFEVKAGIEAYAKQQLSAVTVVVPGILYSHLARPIYSQRRADGTVRFCLSDKNADPSVGFLDVADIGVFVSDLPIMTSPIGSASSFASTYSSITSDAAVVEAITPSKIRGFLAGAPHGEMIAQAMIDMFAHLDETPEGTTVYGAMKRSEDTSKADLGVEATSFENWLRKSG